MRRADPPKSMGASSESAERWGLTDAIVGLVVSIVLAGLVGAAVITARGDYTGKWSEHGAAAGRIAAQIATDGTLTAPQLTPLWLITLLQVPLWLGLLGTVAYAAKKGHGVVADFGLRMQPRDIGVGLVVGFLAQVGVIPLVYWPILKLLGEPDISVEARSLTDRAHGVGVLLLVLLTVVGAPIVEELFFRGLVLRSFERRLRPPLAIGATAVLFSLAHFQVLQFLALVIFGVIAGVLAHRAQRLGPAIWAHVAFNATTVIALLLR
ncbi:MAG: CPBP family intramembrane metalloprotease [Actinobacteria bacterium]|nr:MAG: CPBP family intramembrane metalloprotease [Actinomycetota bacterium]